MANKPKCTCGAAAKLGAFHEYDAFHEDDCPAGEPSLEEALDHVEHTIQLAQRLIAVFNLESVGPNRPELGTYMLAFQVAALLFGEGQTKLGIEEVHEKCTRDMTVAKRLVEMLIERGIVSVERKKL